MKKSRIARLAPVLLLAFVGVYAAPSNAVVPAGLTQQGRILDADGNPLNADVTITFTIYDDPEAAEPANALWTESQEITMEDGYFSTRLGDDADNEFPAGLFDGSVRYIGVQIGSDDEMRPRERIGSVPYAFMANDVVGDIHPTSVSVNGAVVIDATGAWRGNAVDRNLTTLLSIVNQPATGAAAQLKVAEATCAAGQRVTGGGCNTTSGGGAGIKANYPSGASTWSCSCLADANQTCNVTAYAVCARP